MKNKILIFAVLMLLIILACVPAFAVECEHESLILKDISHSHKYDSSGQVLITESGMYFCADCGAYVADYAPAPYYSDVVWYYETEHICPEDIRYSRAACPVCDDIVYSYSTVVHEYGSTVREYDSSHEISEDGLWHYNMVYMAVYCDGCGLWAADAGHRNEDSMYTPVYSDFYYNTSREEYGRDLQNVCDDCGEVVSGYLEFIPFSSDSQIFTLVATSDFGERIPETINYHIGLTGRTVGMGAGQNIVSHARRSGYFDSYEKIAVFRDDSGEYWVFGHDRYGYFSSFEGDLIELIGTPVLITALQGSQILTDVVPVGKRLTTYACQLVYYQNRLFYNGSELQLDFNFKSCYKRQFQYLTYDFIVPYMTKSRWLSYVDFSRCRFVDVDFDGDYDVMFYDTVLTGESEPTFGAGGCRLADDGANVALIHEGSYTYTMTSAWLTSEYLSYNDNRLSTVGPYTFTVRMVESSETATCVKNAVLYLDSPPVYQFTSIELKFDPTQHEKTYVPQPSDFAVDEYYSNSLVRHVPDFVLKIQNNNGKILLYVGDKLVKEWTNLSWYNERGSYLDGYEAGIVQANLDKGNWMRALINGTWFVAADGVTLFLDQNIAGYTGWDIVMGLLVILVIFIVAVLIFKK